MAQVVLSAVGTALGGPVGGFIGNVIGSAAVRTLVNSLAPARQIGSRLTGLQLNQSSQGDPVKQVYGRARVAGTLIWAARLKENRNVTRASKTAPKTESFTYSLSFAIALCEGAIDGIGRIWADGQLLDQSQICYRLYLGDETQTPDSLIEAIEGTAPAYRGLAYMVFEELDITQFGNRPPNLSVEIFRRPKGAFADLESLVTGVCLIPGAGEFIYATSPNAVLDGLTRASYETQHTGDGRTDFVVSLDQLQSQLPNVKRVNLVISWFGTDLRAGHCTIKPGVEVANKSTTPLVWSVSGIDRGDAHVVSTVDGRPAYGGTPCDAVVIEAIQALTARGYEVTLIPFILMDIPAGNSLPDPYGGAPQASYPWRGRITSTADMTAGATSDVAAFMGTAQASDFAVTSDSVAYAGPDEWSFRRFVLHVAALGKQAGGVHAVLLGSELRGLTTLRSGVNSYPMVAALQALAAEVRTLNSSHTQISYGADWSEYFGHQPADGSGHVAFHLDPLWSNINIDFIGIDWYASLTDWRDGTAHFDYEAGYTSIYDEAYLHSRIRGGEGFDWYYASSTDRTAQVRTTISDGAYNEPWVYRPKDIVSWWSNAHYDRPGGTRASSPTAWVPQSKPIRFIEIGCGAVDKGPNAPNLFFDPKSSESAIPSFSSGARDDRAQRAYLTAFADYYAVNNPVSSVYGAPMLADMSVWCWDARPYPYFPQRSDVWGDTLNWRTGHWLNGRVGTGDARNLIADITGQAGVTLDQLNVDEVTGSIDGYVIEQPMSAADALSPLLGYLGLEVSERGETLTFIGREHGLDAALLRGNLAYNDQSPLMARRDLIDIPASLTLRCYDLDRDYQLQSMTVRRDDRSGASQIGLDVLLCLTGAQATAYAAYVLNQAQAIRQTLTLDIDPLDMLRLEVGDGLTLEGDVTSYRLISVDQSETPSMTLQPAPASCAVVSPDPSATSATSTVISSPIITGFTLLELPCFGANETNVKPILVASADPWSGADVYGGASADSLRLRGRVDQAASIGATMTALPVQRGNYLLREASLDIYLEGDAPVSRSEEELLSGDNFICVKAQNGEWEILQYLSVTALAVDRYRLSGLIRGQWGSEQALNAGVAEGARVILLPPGYVRADMTSDELNLDRLWRTGRTGFGGVADQALDAHATWTGLALRPRAPVHGAVTASGGDLVLSWLRVARYGGDGWDTEPPLCEDYELYRVSIYDGGTLKRTVEVSAPAYVYGAADQAVDFPSGFNTGSRIEIAQKSQVYGYGPVLTINLA